MADYTLDPVHPPTRRLRYYNNQLLRDQDFIDEQRYHIDRLHRTARALLTPGRIQGLVVQVEPGDQPRVTVGPGAAVDRAGRWLVLSAPAACPAAHGALVGAAWREAEAGQQEGNDTRF